VKSKEKIDLCRRIALGTAQFGIDYGINNKTGIVPEKEVHNILNFALENNINFLDTASAYGTSEKVIGSFPDRKNFNIISKFSNCKISEIKNLLQSTLDNLKTDSIYGYLFHSFKDFKNNPELLQVLKEIQSTGIIKKIGFSLYITSELDFLLDNNVEFETLQIPYNVFDRRFEKYFDRLKSKNIEIHLRSIYLQGLIFKKPDELNSYFKDFKKSLMDFDKISHNLNATKQEIALNFCLSNGFADKVIIGVDNFNHVRETIRAMEKLETINKSKEILDILKTENENFLLPFKWESEKNED